MGDVDGLTVTRHVRLLRNRLEHRPHGLVVELVMLLEVSLRLGRLDTIPILPADHYLEARDSLKEYVSHCIVPVGD